ncbi:NADH-quinone oxidoreductase subunit L [Rickettsiaceae bacterium]|nr:NADH-quinone oxidoreductase subunit L [Rickettsiaceae bacterium]
MELILKSIIFLPLISAAINGMICKRITKCTASYIAGGAIIATAICAFMIFVKAGINQETMHLTSSWLVLDSLKVNWSIYVDQLTAIMFLLVTTVSAVVHIYSLGYMADDKNLPKFLSYLSLFTFFMLSLVSSDNFLQLFFGWEGVGLCSYLLIGYYYQKDSANNAAIKAFVVNRVGDFAFIIGIVMILLYTGSLDFYHVFQLSEILSATHLNILGTDFVVLDIICLMLFLGCMGKSAQIGMHVWLPDAMEGPTPVSALIHAATMVTAGVFLVARCSFMFEYSTLVLQIITIVGGITCLFAALVAIAQEDIKKIIAYSTCSQLGYMFVACGVSAYQAGIFHLVTHGFFKALLFLSAGSVIHSCHEQDVFKMGGLRRKMPITYANFWIGSLAIIGIYPFAGFYSKDLVLESAYGAGLSGNIAFTLGIIAAILTAIYSLKIIILTFHGSTRLSKSAFDHAHESPNIMNIPLMILNAGALFSGMVGYYILSIHSPYGFFSGSIFNLNIPDQEHHAPFLIESLPLIVGIVGIMIGVYIYKCNKYSELKKQMKDTYHIIHNKFFFDEIYEKLFIHPTKILSKWSSCFDMKLIDRFGPNGFSALTKICSWCICKVQTGYIYNYVFYIVCGIVLYVTILVSNYVQQLWVM